MYTFICYPKCSTCRRAKAWLREHNIPFEERDIKENKPSLEELRAWYRQAELPLKSFFNTSGTVYKSLGLKDRLASMGEEEQLALLAGDGMLVKRPLLIGEALVLVGFREEAWENRLK